MIKNLKEIKHDHIRLSANEHGLWLEVQEIDWVSSYESVSRWKAVKQLGAPSEPEEMGQHLITPTLASSPNWVVSPHEIEKAIDQLLANRRYFQICGRCRHLHPVGHMHNDFACQSCAEKIMGAVY
jgi:hypothetical protein